ncbi:MAG: type II toxin-antitoxin system VapC family toxin [Actinomycetota bacterium]|nr:type II toxin-antitoxin system VapC family toxin [Actinomycetota bacterium]
MTEAPRYVLDASALIATLGDEPGGELVEPLLEGALVSSVNWAEVLQSYEAAGLPLAGRLEQIESLGVTMHPFDSRQAELTAGLYSRTREAGLGIADRACLALALDRGAQPVTADRAWAKVDVGVDVRLIR